MKPLARIVLAIVLLGTLSLRTLPDIANTYVVTTILDTDVDGCGVPPADECSLREALNAANGHSGIRDIIAFGILGSGVKLLRPLTPLPLIIDPVRIDGYTQTGAAEATESSPAQLMIEIDGMLLSTDPVYNVGLVLLSSGSTIRGLSMHNFDNNCIHIETDLLGAGNVSDDNILEGNLIGLEPTGVIGINYANGIFVGGGATGNLIGGDEPAERNVISGSVYSGVEIHGTGTSGNTVSGNWIGTDLVGDSYHPNWWHGVRIYGGASGNTIGGEEAGEGNVISGNLRSGVQILGAGTDNNVVAGNLIGLNSDGDAALHNEQNGVVLEANVGGPQGNVIGGDSTGERNVISGNRINGVLLTGVGTQGNIVSGNYIGLSADGTLGLGNEEEGISIEAGASGNTIGGDAESERNIISANGPFTGLPEVSLTGVGTDGNVVTRNYIGTDPTGTIAMGEDNGVYVAEGATHTLIGGTTVAAGNLISGNGGRGISVRDAGTTGTVISANAVGVDASGRLSLPNGFYGISVSGASDVTIGGETPGEANVISGNLHGGIMIDGASDVVVRNNLIGVDRGRALALGNSGKGVTILLGSTDNTVGPGNVIMNNTDLGVDIKTNTSIRNVVTRNVLDLNGATSVQLNVDGDANGGILPPSISSTALGSVDVAGTACAGCTVEVFGNLLSGERGRSYLGTTVADGLGAWSLALPGLAYPYLTATATDASKGTSEFSDSFSATVRSLFLPLVLRQFP